MKIYLLVLMYYFTPPEGISSPRATVETMQFKSFQSCEVARENFIPKQFNSFKLLGTTCTIVEDQSVPLETE